MDNHCARIKLLPLEVQGQIRSSIAVTSLEDVVLELLKNSLDAGARHIEIQTDFSKGYCSVSDNGVGIPAEDFGADGCLGKMHCTSKHLGSSQSYGQYGRFLSCLSSLSLLSIVSRQRNARLESSLTFHRGRVISRAPDVASKECILDTYGTRVVMRDLFGNMPVRLKHRAIQFEAEADSAKEFDVLKKRIVAVLLAFSQPINLHICDLHSKHTYMNRTNPQESNYGVSKQKNYKFSAENIHRTLVQAGYISSRDRENWKMASAKTTAISIRASISLTPAPSRNRQFMSLGGKPLDPIRNGLLFDEVNRLFDLSAYGSPEEAQQPAGLGQLRQLHESITTNENTHRELRAVAKGVDKWPMFYIRIDPRLTSMHEAQLEEEGGSNNLLHSIVELLRSLIHEFLVAHGFKIKSRKLRRSDRISLDRTMSDPWLHDRRTSLANKPARLSTSVSQTGQSKPFPVQNSRDVTLDGPYNNWRQIKSTAPNAIADLLSGLPKNKQDESARIEENVDPLDNDSKIGIGKRALEDLCRQQAFQSDFQLLLDNLDDDFSEEAEPCSESLPIDIYHRAEDQAYTGAALDQIQETNILLWTDSRTGRPLRIDARTGLILSETLRDKDFNRSSMVKRRKGTAYPLLATKHPNKEKLELRVNRLLRNSESLVFRTKEEPINSTGCGIDHLSTSDVDGRRHGSHCRTVSTAFMGEMLTVEHRLARSSLRKAAVLAQVDRKFILARLLAAKADDLSASEDEEQCQLLVLIDQHAADERIKVEQLYDQFCAANAVSLQKPIIFEISSNEAAMFAQRKDFFQRWNIILEIKNSLLHKPTGELPAGIEQHVAVMGLPPLIAERCRLEPKIIIDMLRKEVWSDEASNSTKGPRAETRSVENGARGWPSSLAGCPLGLLDMMNSRACRSAVMFNDVLSVDECRGLVRRLAECVLPFQCAHGRPSVVVLTELGRMGGLVDGAGVGERTDCEFGEAWRRWQAVEVTKI